MVAYATFFCICASLDLSTTLEMTSTRRMIIPLFVISTGENLWFLEWRNLFFYSSPPCNLEIIYFPFRLSEWSVAHGEICVFYFGFVLVIWVMFIFTSLLRILEGHFKGVRPHLAGRAITPSKVPS